MLSRYIFDLHEFSVAASVNKNCASQVFVSASFQVELPGIKALISLGKACILAGDDLVSALEIFLLMRYINRRFTYLLAYLLTYLLVVDRFSSTLQMVQAAGEVNRIQQGLFENYLESKVKDPHLLLVSCLLLP